MTLRMIPPERATEVLVAVASDIDTIWNYWAILPDGTGVLAETLSVRLT